MTTPQSTISGNRPVRFVGAALAAVAVVLPACTPPTGPTTPGRPTKEGRCAADEGVTVVVDSRRCRTGWSSVRPGPSRAALPRRRGQPAGRSRTDHRWRAKIDGLPTQGYPFCWTTGGYWSCTGRLPPPERPGRTRRSAAANAIPAGAVEGWRFAAFSAGTAVPPASAPPARSSLIADDRQLTDPATGRPFPGDRFPAARIQTTTNS